MTMDRFDDEDSDDGDGDVDGDDGDGDGDDYGQVYKQKNTIGDGGSTAL